jgi:nicotinate-nucleotide--dimethylbenzimidazole phosphoribosyltransferase
MLLVGLVGCDDKPVTSADPAPPEAPATAAPEAANEPAEAPPPEADDAADEGEAPAEPKAAANEPPRVDRDAPQGKTAAKEEPPTAEKKAEPAEPAEKPKGPVVGQPSQLTASAAADPGYKCNDAYPHKFITSGGSNVTYPDPKPRGACAGKKGVAVSVPFVPTAAGPGSIAGELRYGICDEGGTNCVVKKKQVTLSFTAN